MTAPVKTWKCGTCQDKQSMIRCHKCGVLTTNFVERKSCMNESCKGTEFHEVPCPACVEEIDDRATLLLLACLRNPDDETARGAYADLLEEEYAVKNEMTALMRMLGRWEVDHLGNICWETKPNPDGPTVSLNHPHPIPPYNHLRFGPWHNRPQCKKMVNGKRCNHLVRLPLNNKWVCLECFLRLYRQVKK